MKNKTLCCGVFLFVSSLAFADYGPYPDHPDLNDANTDVYAALGDLAQARGSFGGFREEAEEALNQALPDIYQAVLYANANPSGGACESSPYQGRPDPYPRHPELSRAEARLERAVVSLKNACNGANQFGGHREDAIGEVQQAESDIAWAVDWADHHP
jgi:hypothetical protein